MSLKRLAVGYLLETRPPFMLAAVLVSVLGGAMAPHVDLGKISLFATAIFFTLYVAHLRDTYFDFFIRGEYKLGYRSRAGDAGGVLTKEELALGIGFGVGIFLVLTAYLVWISSLLLLPIMLTAFILALVYVPYLDRTPIVSTIWPLGILCAILGGFVVQAGGLSMEVLILGSIIWLLLVGGKQIDDLPDLDVDVKLKKRTLAVILGFKRAKRLGYLLILAGLGLGFLLSVVGLLPTFTMCSFAPALPLVYLSWGMNPRRGVMVLIIAAYLILVLETLFYLW